MIIFLDFPLYLMETFKHCSSLHGYVLFMFLTTISKGSACEAPSSPQCFRQTAQQSVYTCEWGLNTNESDVTFDLYFNKTQQQDPYERERKFPNIKKTRRQFNEEQLIKYSPVDIWVEAHVRNSSCTSPRRTVVLGHTVKYEPPRNIEMSWSKNNLSLSWRAAEEHPALAEVWFRPDTEPAESWEKRLKNTTYNASMYHLIVVNLLKNSIYQVQIRQQSTEARHPLWSDWSPVVIVPAELEHEPKITVTTRLINGTRKVTLTWEPTPQAAAVGGVTYSVNDTQSSRGCPCTKKRHHISKNKYTTYVSYSAVNISVVARNAAGHSPPAILHVPAESVADVKPCDKTLLNEKLNSKTCLEWYELQDADSRPKNVKTLTRRTKKEDKKKIRMSMTDYIRYLYFEHRCAGGKPQTVKMCLFYQNESAPVREPQDFIAFSETPSSVNVSWKAIPYADQRGFLTHYNLCSVKISPRHENEECHKISASVTKYRLENLTPGAKYNISLAGVTQMGAGPTTTVSINTKPEKRVNVWLSFGLLFVFFLLSTMCTVILKRIKNKIFPPVPTPVIPDFTLCQPENQEMLERKEEVHEVTLHQLHPEGKSVSEEAEEATVLRGEWPDGTEEDLENERSDSGGSSDECLSTGSTDQALRNSREGEVTNLEQVDNELAMLIYRNGLVFDVKSDSP